MADGPPAGAARDVELLVGAVRDLSHARSLGDVMAVVRSAAREIAAADGATFILREDDVCHYADEDAIAPLWKGRRFPADDCVSGLAMRRGLPVLIEDVFADERVPHDLYRPTFVKSLAVVPIGAADAIGAIGVYWSTRRRATPDEVRLLRALADATSVAIENVGVYTRLEQAVADRTAELERANGELEASNASLREFVAVAAHDLRGPLASIRMATDVLSAGQAGDDAETLMHMVHRQAEHLAGVVDGLMTLSLADSGGLKPQPESVVLRDAVELACAGAGAGAVEVDVPNGMRVWADEGHVQRIVGNFVGNAVRYGAEPVSVVASAEGDAVSVLVTDAGPGVDAAFVPRLFARFARSAAGRGVDGAGLGLSIAAALARANGGDVFYRAAQPRGASFGVVLPAVPNASLSQVVARRDAQV